MLSDLTSLVLQSAGGSIADAAKTHQHARKGIDHMIAGLILQVVSLGLFLFISADFTWTCRKGAMTADAVKQRTRDRSMFKIFLACLVLATVVILIRSVFRVAELWEGFSGSLWNAEVDFVFLDGAMISISVICLTALHPGLAFEGR